jgi:hypothetical protein
MDPDCGTSAMGPSLNGGMRGDLARIASHVLVRLKHESERVVLMRRSLRWRAHRRARIPVSTRCCHMSARHYVFCELSAAGGFP